jgi:chromosome segregation ATPase
MKTPILYGSVLALFGGIIYCVVQINDLKTQIADTRASIESEVDKVTASAATTTKSHKATIDALKAELAESRQKSSQLVGQAKIEAEHHADQIAADLKKAQDAQAAATARVAASVTDVSNQVSAVKEDTNQNKQAVAAVNTEVSAVKTQAEATRAELQKTISDLTSTKGDLGVQSGLIATNAAQLKALKELGERNYTEFRVAKAKTGQRVGDLQIRLTKTDPKKNRFTVEVVVDDKLIEKKDRTVNEPIQFLLPRATQPYELVVNEVRKDMIVGYVSAPRVQNARK